MPKFSHAYDFAFEVLSDDEFAEDVTPAMLREALLRRINETLDDGLLLACGRFDTMEVET